MACTLRQRSRRRYSLGIVAGTFSKFHKGHRYLLSRAFSLADIVIVCLTTDDFARRLGKEHPVEEYCERLKSLVNALRDMGTAHRAIIWPLNDMYGPAVTEKGAEVLFVSEESFLRGLKVNRARVSRGLRGLDIYVVPLLLAEDGRPISSTRIWRGEIDAEGRAKAKIYGDAIVWRAAGRRVDHGLRSRRAEEEEGGAGEPPGEAEE